MAIVTYEEASQIVSQEQKKLNSRRLPPTLLMISKLMAEQSIYACNVGPWGHVCDRPSLLVVIPPYDAKADTMKMGYAKSDPFPAIHRFAKIVSEDEMGWCEDDGRTVLRDLIGDGFGLPAGQSLTRYGVFVPADKLPTNQEVQAANKKLDLYLDALIREAKEAYDQGGEARKAIYEPGSRYLEAARMKGVNEAWVVQSAGQQSVQCASCGRFNPAGVAKCQCGIIIDFDVHFRIEEEQKRRLAEFEDRMTKPPKK